MTRRTLPLLALAVAVLVAVVAIVAHGRPLSSGAGSGGLPNSFWDFTFTSVIILCGLLLLIVIVATILTPPEMGKWRPRRGAGSWRSLVLLAALVGIAALILNFRHPSPHTSEGPGLGGINLGNPSDSAHAVEFRWVEVVIVAALLIAVAAIFAVTRKRSQPKPAQHVGAPAVVAAALDDSLDDLRTDPDLRRAIVAAYARMETALAAAGLPRQPAEAPLEYFERAFLSLDTSGASVRRLTDLFEWARFSQHEPEPAMRDEAVEALEAVRDELRAAVKVVA